MMFRQKYKYCKEKDRDFIVRLSGDWYGSNCLKMKDTSYISTLECRKKLQHEDS